MTPPAHTSAGLPRGNNSFWQAARTWPRRHPAWLFLAPAVLSLLLVAMWPLLRTLFFSLTDARLDEPDLYNFVGLQNFLYILQDRLWWQAVANTLTFSLVSVSIETVLGLAIALLLNQALPWRGAMRAALLIPWSLPVVVSAKIWEWMLHDQFGIINQLLLNMGLISKGMAWTADPQLIMPVIIFIDVWITTPFMVLLILAGLQTIPEEMMEAAYTDGVPCWKRFWSLTLPLLRPALGVAVLFRMLDALRMFDLSYVIAGNGDRTMTLSIYARNELISFQSLGGGSAASTLVFFFISLCAILLIRLVRLDRAAIQDRSAE